MQREDYVENGNTINLAVTELNVGKGESSANEERFLREINPAKE